MRDEVIELLKSQGELTLQQIQPNFPAISKKTVSSNLTRMAEIGMLNRRKIDTPYGYKWSYSVVDRGPYLFGEPDYCYYLRTLPNHTAVEA
jgi:DNA-binding HxlR family transcriptional regulator